jgi:hypothetical protein
MPISARVALCTLVCVSAVPLFIIACEPGKTSERDACQQNLTVLWTCLWLYAGQHDGSLPVTLSEFYPELLAGANGATADENLALFVCPASDRSIGDPARIDEWSSYTYLAPSGHIRSSDMNKEVDKSKVLFRERGRNHGGHHVLYVGGGVAFVEEVD